MLAPRSVNPFPLASTRWFPLTRNARLPCGGGAVVVVVVDVEGRVVEVVVVVVVVDDGGLVVVVVVPPSSPPPGRPPPKRPPPPVRPPSRLSVLGVISTAARLNWSVVGARVLIVWAPAPLVRALRVWN